MAMAFFGCFVKHRSHVSLLLALPLIFLSLSTPYAYAFKTGEAATLVIGQKNSTSGSSGTTATTLNEPEGFAFDKEGDLWVSDWENNRVLSYKAPFSIDEAASLVIGQTSFTSGGSGTTATTLNNPNAVAFDKKGDLWVSDDSNNRILMYKPPLGTGEAASLVIGQTSLTSGGSGTTATTLNQPDGVAFDAKGSLWVADGSNNRVLMYPPPFGTGEAATLVIGQIDLNSGGSGTTATTLNGPDGIAFDKRGDLWVSEWSNNRIVMYKPPFKTGEAASLVIGQTSLTSGGSGTTKTTLYGAQGVAFDKKGNLWVPDCFNNRVLMYPSPFSTGEAATLVIGQRDFTSNGYGTTATTLHYPGGPAFDKKGDLWVSDYGNNRVLMYP
jgi:sugar lactone lactonase YvrE